MFSLLHQSSYIYTSEQYWNFKDFPLDSTLHATFLFDIGITRASPKVLRSLELEYLAQRMSKLYYIEVSMEIRLQVGLSHRMHEFFKYHQYLDQHEIAHASRCWTMCPTQCEETIPTFMVKTMVIASDPKELGCAFTHSFSCALWAFSVPCYAQ